jgi:hypothetical protein
MIPTYILLLSLLLLSTAFFFTRQFGFDISPFFSSLSDPSPLFPPQLSRLLETLPRDMNNQGVGGQGGFSLLDLSGGGGGGGGGGGITMGDYGLGDISRIIDELMAAHPSMVPLFVSCCFA